MADKRKNPGAGTNHTLFSAGFFKKPQTSAEQRVEQNDSGPVVDILESTHSTVTSSVNENTKEAPDHNIDKPESATQGNTVLFSDSNRKISVTPVSTKDAKQLLETSFADCSHLHSYYCCQEEHCTNISKTEYERIKTITRDKFQHHWIFDKELSYCKKTG
ncbi:Hypothetical predicted protein, partial [Paramuricea clavata]